jgi:hypothetical protein
MEPEHGRSRVYAQWLNTEDEIQSAIDSCPVSCIHWVQKDQLPALEYVMQVRVRVRARARVCVCAPVSQVCCVRRDTPIRHAWHAPTCPRAHPEDTL